MEKSIRKRRGTPPEWETSVKAPVMAGGPQQRSTQRRDLLIFLGAFLLMIGSSIGYLIYRLGFAFLIPSYFKTLHLTPVDAEMVVDSHTFLFIGGPHRGGTTVLWECLREHPSISGFADRVGADYSEGMFLQSVYPTMGIGSEMGTAQQGFGGGRRKKRSKLTSGMLEGLGGYAFNPEYHLTESAASVAGRTTLMNEWGYQWDLNQPVLLEKSPPNMIISRFLQSMFSPGMILGGLGSHNGEMGREGREKVEGKEETDEDGGGRVVGRTSRAHFVFITRHPIVNAMALGKYSGVGKDGMPDVFEQVLHWVISHDILVEDLQELQHAKLIRFEDFVLDPQTHVDEILTDLGLLGVNETTQYPLQTTVFTTTNMKYERRYCEWVGHSPSNLATHRRLSSKLGPRVKSHGYDLDSFTCLKRLLGAMH
ncbi:unnamed protein product [Choristocarpus tenellus]